MLLTDVQPYDVNSMSCHVDVTSVSKILFCKDFFNQNLLVAPTFVKRRKLICTPAIMIFNLINYNFYILIINAKMLF